jgi:hypothetical protein
MIDKQHQQSDVSVTGLLHSAVHACSERHKLVVMATQSAIACDTESHADCFVRSVARLHDASCVE